MSVITSTCCPVCKRDMVVKKHRMSLHEYKGKCLKCKVDHVVSTLEQRVYTRRG